MGGYALQGVTTFSPLDIGEIGATGRGGNLVTDAVDLYLHSRDVPSPTLLSSDLMEYLRLQLSVPLSSGQSVQH